MIDHRTAPYAAFTLRIALGAMFISHALLKYFIFTLPAAALYFESLGLPGSFAYFTFAIELVGGVLILTGVYSRWISAALVTILLGATWAHFGNGWFFSSPNGGWEYPAFLALAAIAQALLGDGKFALSNAVRTPSPVHAY